MESESLKTVRIKSLSHGACDGTKLGFRMSTADGMHKDVHLSVGDAEKFVAFIITTLQQATPLVPSGSPKTLNAQPIPVRTIGSFRHPTDGSTLLSVDLGLFQLTFVLPAGLVLPPPG